MSTRKYGFMKIPAMLFGLAMLTSCDDPTGWITDRGAERAEQERLERLRAEESRIRNHETERARMVARVDEIKRLAIARLARNKMAAAALAAAGGGAVGALSDRLSENERNAAIGIAVLGVGYCVFNYQECESLTLDIQGLMSQLQRLEGEIEALNGRAGHRLVVSNRCGEPMVVAIETVTDPVLGNGRHGWWTISPGNSNALFLDSEFYIRATSPSVSYVAYPGRLPDGVSMDTVQMKTASAEINTRLELVLSIGC